MDLQAQKVGKTSVPLIGATSTTIRIQQFSGNLQYRRKRKMVPFGFLTRLFRYFYSPKQPAHIKRHLIQPNKQNEVEQ